MSRSLPATLPISLKAVATAALITLSLGSAHATNGYFAHGYGTQSLGLAGVAIALPQDALVIASNPAGLSQLDSRLDVGLSWFAPRRSATITGNQVPGFNGQYSGDGKRNFWLPEFGYNRKIDDRLSVGVALYGNGGMNTRYERNPFGAIGGQGRAGVNLEQIFLSPALSYKLNESHALGLSLNLAHQRFSAEGLQPFSSASASPNDVSNRGTDTSNGAGVRVGWLGQLTPELKVGFSWASAIKGRFSKYQGLFAEKGRFDIPSNWGLGLSYQVTPAWLVAVDYQHIEYSSVKSIANPLSRLLAGQQLGRDSGPGFGWEDVGVIKLGVQHRYSDALTLRAGYSRARQPIPSDQTFFNILAPGVVQNHITAGFTWKASDKGEWTGYLAEGRGKTVSGSSSIPQSFGGGEANIRLKEHIVGIGYGWKF